MSFKHYFPTFRARWLFLRRALFEMGRVRRALHVGCGEGDLDRLIKEGCDELVSCDVNEADVEHARALNRDVGGIEYRVEDGTALRFPNGSFDAVVCMEVIEHVPRPEALLSELARVVAPGGRVVMTCPSERFPLTYDPVNFVLAAAGKHLPIGAYAYGHEWLVKDEALRDWVARTDLRLLRAERLTGWVAAPLECYWAGLAQRAMKANARNDEARPRRGVRPSRSVEPRVVGLVDALVAADAAATRGRERSVGLGYVLERPSGRARPARPSRPAT